MKSNKTIDIKLIQAHKDGNQEALAALVKRWHLKFCKKAYWIVKDQDLSKDIAQDSWQTIIAKLNTLEDSSKFGCWALRIVCNKAFDMLRSQQRKHLKETRIRNEQEAIYEVYNEQSHLKKALAKAIAGLPSEQQSVIRLFYLEAYS